MTNPAVREGFGNISNVDLCVRYVSPRTHRSVGTMKVGLGHHHQVVRFHITPARSRPASWRLRWVALLALAPLVYGSGTASATRLAEGEVQNRQQGTDHVLVLTWLKPAPVNAQRCSRARSRETPCNAKSKRPVSLGDRTQLVCDDSVMR